MNQPTRKIDQRQQNRDRPSNFSERESSKQSDIAQIIIDTIIELQKNKKILKDYPIRELVQHAQDFGPELKRQRLETNQIRKFLDAINQLKAKLVGNDFSVIETEVVLLKPKLAYAAARQDAVKSLNRVMSVAIDRVLDEQDFMRLVQMMESIIAYHKAEGGK